jgi:dipeptidyl aminopeptidase/acylaminoacyl peptidase
MLAIAAAVIAGAGLVSWIQRRAVSPAATPIRALTRITFEDGLQGQPTWSPDGKFIAYVSNHGGNVDIWVQPLAGGRAVRVTSDPANDWQPDWSPDGNNIVFRSERDGGGIFTRFTDPGRRLVTGSGSGLGVSGDRLVVPILERAGSVWVLDHIDR